MWYTVFYVAMWIVSHVVFRFKINGIENVPKGAAVICGNHSSNWDVAFLTVALGRKIPLRFTPKIGLKKIPIIGPMMNLVGVIWIDRSKPNDITPVRKMLSALTSGDKIVLFPEGRRVREGESEAAKTGAVMVASKTGVPLVPVHIPRVKRPFSRIILTFGEPYIINTQGTAERRIAADELMLRISELSES